MNEWLQFGSLNEADDKAWLSKLPRHWQRIKAGFLFREVVDLGHSDLELLSIRYDLGVVRQPDSGRKNRAPDDRSQYKRIKPGELAYNLMNVRIGSIGVSSFDGILSPAYAVCAPKRQMNSWYYHYLFRTPIYIAEFIRNAYGIVDPRLRLYFDRFKAIYVPYPPLDEQNRIVAFIRVKEKAIENLITNKQRLIELLTEKKMSIITSTAIKGIQPHVKTKASEVGWLDEIPEQWRILKLKFVAKIASGSTPSSENSDYWDGEIVWVTPEDISKVNVIRNSARRITSSGLSACSAVVVPAGSIIVTSRAPVGNVAVAGVDLCTNQGCKAIVPNLDILDPQYSFFILLSLQPELQRLAQGPTFTEISTPRLKNVKIPVPPIEEQRTIVEHINEESRTTNEAILQTQREIDLIQEYRTRIITDVVTGRIDLRKAHSGWVAE